MFFNKDESPMVRFFSGGGGSKPKAPKSPAKPAKQEEVRKIVDTAGEAKKEERKRTPPGRKANIFGGIEKELVKRLG